MAELPSDQERLDKAVTAMRAAPGKPATNGKPASEPVEQPIAEYIREWLTGCDEHYDRQGQEATRHWARAILEIERQRLAYKERMLAQLAK